MVRWLSVFMTLCVVACSGSSDQGLARCKTNDDCMAGQRCLAGACSALEDDEVHTGSSDDAGEGADEMDAGSDETDADGPELRVLAIAVAEGAEAEIETTLEGAGSCEASRCTLAADATVRFRARGVEGYRFAGWSGDAVCKGDAETVSLSALSETTRCVANYVRRVRVRGLVAGAEFAVAASSSGEQARCAGSECDVDARSEVVLSVPTRAGLRLSRWSGEGCGESADARLNVTTGERDLTCTAHFVNTFVVAGAAEGADAALQASSSDASARCAGARCELDAHGSARLEAPSVPGFRFTGFTGPAQCVGDAPALSIADVQSDLMCTAHYLQRFSVRGVAQGPAPLPQIQASSEDTFASCTGAECQVDRAGSATLLAPTVAGYRLRGWQGEGCGEETAAALTLREVARDLVCSADYVRGVGVTGAVVGASVRVTASSSSPGAACSGASCTIDSGGSVTLSVPSAPGFNFGGWSGDPGCSGTSSTLTLSAVSTSRTCLATFTRVRLRVAGSVMPAGSGIVAFSGYSATAACNASGCTIDYGTRIVLSANPAPGFEFERWSGCSTSTESTLTLSDVRSAQTCTANFARQRFSVSATSSTGGSVVFTAATPNGTCGTSSCSVDYDGSVSLEARPSSGAYRFSAWSGCSASTANPLTLSGIRAPATCRANFVPRYTVRGNVTPAGTGSVSARSTSTAASCSGAACTVDSGGRVTLSVAASTGYRFVEWSGCVDAVSSASLVRDPVMGNETCLARFTVRTFPITIGTNASSSVTVYNVAYGGSFAIDAPPVPPGFDYFSSWLCDNDHQTWEARLSLSGITTAISCRAYYDNVR